MDTVEPTHQPNHLNQAVSSNLNEIHRIVYAGFAPRFFAYIIDLIVIWSLNSIITRPLLRLTNLSEAELWIELFSAANITQSIVFFLYFILMTFFFRATLGKMVLGLSVESLKGDQLTKGQIIFREFIGRYISMAVIGLPYLVVIFTKKHQGIHDLFADTSVIKDRMKKFNKEIETSIQ
ncbi:RDD family protein [Halobacillus sp. A5]|uniref:RDD family protein n=1 Tax=Halobacillus sp. A5 TaxID=2880263 RepID=UPI0020A65BEB|nr:RDD family protein [Halobacillus sp. A5]MCP3029128.1 RDD family protein [Halobacillus sp. A5]